MAVIVGLLLKELLRVTVVMDAVSETEVCVSVSLCELVFCVTVLQPSVSSVPKFSICTGEEEVGDSLELSRGSCCWKGFVLYL